MDHGDLAPLPAETARLSAQCAQLGPSGSSQAPTADNELVAGRGNSEVRYKQCEQDMLVSQLTEGGTCLTLRPAAGWP